MGHGQKGYSLLEITVVLVLIAVLGALVAPRYADLRDGIAVRSAATDLVQTLATARRTALTRRTAVAVVFDTASGAIQVRSLGQPIVRHALALTYGVRLAADRDSAVYDARGLGYGASNLSVIIKRGNAVDTVVLARLGRVRW